MTWLCLSLLVVIGVSEGIQYAYEEYVSRVDSQWLSHRLDLSHKPTGVIR